jgi:hypothetical protein
MRINTRKINKIHKKNKTNKKRYIRKRKSQKKRKTRKQRGGLASKLTQLSAQTPTLFNFLNELKEVGKNQYPGDHCHGTGGMVNLAVYEHGNCTGITNESGNVKKVEMNNMVNNVNKPKFLESLGFIEKKKFVESLSLDHFLITKSKWSSSSKITDEKRIDWCKELLSFLTRDKIKKYNIIGAHHNILRGTVIKLSNWSVPGVRVRLIPTPRVISDSTENISGLKNCSCIRIIIYLKEEALNVNVELLYEGEVKNIDNKWNYVTNEDFVDKKTNEDFVDKNHKDSICEIWQDAVRQLVGEPGSTLLSEIGSLASQKMYIDFWRHGDALHNGEVCKIKMLDSPLTKDGIIQAKNAGIYMKDKEYQHCTIGNTRFCCSPLTRTFDTVIVIMYIALSQKNNDLKSLLDKIVEKRLNLLNIRYNSTDMNSEMASKRHCEEKWWNIGIDDRMNKIDQLIFNVNHRAH